MISITGIRPDIENGRISGSTVLGRRGRVMSTIKKYVWGKAPVRFLLISEWKWNNLYLLKKVFIQPTYCCRQNNCSLLYEKSEYTRNLFFYNSPIKCVFLVIVFLHEKNKELSLESLLNHNLCPTYTPHIFVGEKKNCK